MGGGEAFGHVRLAEHHGAGRAQKGDRRSILRHRAPGVGGAQRTAQAGNRERVLDRERNSGERPEPLPRRPPIVDPPRLVERILIVALDDGVRLMAQGCGDELLRDLHSAQLARLLRLAGPRSRGREAQNSSAATSAATRGMHPSNEP